MRIAMVVATKLYTAPQRPVIIGPRNGRHLIVNHVVLAKLD
jgi:hypothetical protein